MNLIKPFSVLVSPRRRGEVAPPPPSTSAVTRILSALAAFGWGVAAGAVSAFVAYNYGRKIKQAVVLVLIFLIWLLDESDAAPARCAILDTPSDFCFTVSPN